MTDTPKQNKVGLIKRVGKLPFYLGFGVVIAIFCVLAYVGYGRLDKPKEKDNNTKTVAANTNVVDDFSKHKIAGFIEPKEPAKPPAPIEPAAKAESKSAVAPKPVASTTNPQQDEQNKIRQMKLQLLKEAIASKITIRMQAPRSQGSSGYIKTAANGNEPTDPISLYKQQLTQLKQAGLIPDNSVSDSTNDDADTGSAATTNPTNGYRQFDKAGKKDDRWYLDSAIDTPEPYQLRAGFVIPGTLISGINSELPGQIVAQVSQNVYDTATGAYLLIPQGTRLVGQYSSEVEYGQSRVLVAWQRLVFPDGKALDIGAMPGGDSAGYAGFNDQVNNHYLRIFGSALIMSAISAGVTYSQRDNQGVSTGGYTAPSANSILSQSLGQQLGQTTSRLIQKNLNIAPTLEIRPGYRFNVIVIKDLTFSKPYESFDY